jgi:phage gpG-like protein
MASRGFRTVFSFDTSNFLLQIAEAKKEYERRAKRAITKGTLLYEREVKKTLSQTGTGREYKRGRKTHIASEAGSPPAVDTGQLRASITHEVVKEFNGWVGKVGSNLEYAAALEFGRLDGSIKARPFMLVTLAAIRPQLLRIFQRELRGGR